MLEMPINYFIFQALTGFSVVINPGKKIALSPLPVALGFSLFCILFRDYRLSIQFILDRLIKRKFQFICQ